MKVLSSHPFEDFILVRKDFHLELPVGWQVVSYYRDAIFVAPWPLAWILRVLIRWSERFDHWLWEDYPVYSEQK